LVEIISLCGVHHHHIVILVVVIFNRIFTSTKIKIVMMLNPAVYWCTNTCPVLLSRTRCIRNDIYVHTQIKL